MVRELEKLPEPQVLQFDQPPLSHTWKDPLFRFGPAIRVAEEGSEGII
jgi:hypothetical protein